MKNIFKLVFTASLVAIIGFSQIACENRSSIEGTWANDEGSYEFIGGKYTFYYFGMFQLAEGTYTINGSSITSRVTRLNQRGLNPMLGYHVDDIIIVDESIADGWLTQDEVINELNRAYREGWISENELNSFSEFVKLLFVSVTTTFSVSGNTLTITYDTGDVLTYTKQ